MKNFLEKYNASKIETSQDEGKLTLETAKERILKLLTENMKNFKENNWNLQNRMNKLIIDTDKRSDIASSASLVSVFYICARVKISSRTNKDDKTRD